MSGPLSNLELPTGQELIGAAHAAFVAEHKRQPAPHELLQEADGVFWAWRDALLFMHATYLRERLGERLGRICVLVEGLALERLDCRGWEFPEPGECDDGQLLDWTANVLACLRWTLRYGDDLLPEVGHADAVAYLARPAVREAPVKRNPAQMGLFDG